MADRQYRMALKATQLVQILFLSLLRTQSDLISIPLLHIFLLTLHHRFYSCDELSLGVSCATCQRAFARSVGFQS